MTVPDVVTALIDHFTQNLDDYKTGRYNETQVRREFIDPFFGALGWDVSNQRGAPETYKDVIHEDAIKIGDAMKAPDYCFRIADTRKFFVEAKKPSVNLKDDIHPAFQLRRYGWSARLPVSILTDFEEFAVYDCRVEPDKNDNAATARIHYLTFDHYADQWDEIAGLFGRDAVMNGSLDSYIESIKTPKGTTTVDDAFLKEIEDWREKLAKNIFRWDTRLSERDLNFAVQMTIDRIIFLRICEDRGIEPYGRLMALQNAGRIYARLCELFRQADERYNSGLFHFKAETGREDPDGLTLRLDMDDKPLRDIIGSLYYPDSPYAFSVIPIEILGHVYERFLGKVISIVPDPTTSDVAKLEIEYKPEVRKAGGVYYTPTYIVDYIVKNTVGKLLEGKTPKEAAKLRILDPACGSGSFLIGAYQYLLDWHRDWYLNDGADKHRKEIYQASGGEWRLTTAARKRILTNNIYGVDIDPQAVETTKLSLLLRVLEGETDESISRQLKMFRERALPDLANNIKCGNSLIGPDFYDDQPMNELSEEERSRINTFDWNAEFAAIMKASGFDAVIGNPPYIRIHQLVDHYPQEVRYIQETYSVAEFGKIDIYVPFIEKALEVLNKNGLTGFIVPNKFMQADYGIGLRRLITNRKCLYHLVDFGYAQVFENATTYTCLLFLCGTSCSAFTALFSSREQAPTTLLTLKPQEAYPTSAITEVAWSLTSTAESRVLRKVETLGIPLPKFLEFAITGVKTGANHIFTFKLLEQRGGLCVVQPEGSQESIELEPDMLRPYWKADSMKRYAHLPAHRLILYPYDWTLAKREKDIKFLVESTFVM